MWATQKAMAQLFDCSTDNIGLHLKNIYDTNELNKAATTEKISEVQQEGAREVRRNTLFYKFPWAIVSTLSMYDATKQTIEMTILFQIRGKTSLDLFQIRGNHL